MKKLILSSPDLPNERVELLPGQLPVVLGRSRSADITINDELLSRRHSEIRVNSFAQFEIHDLDSTNLTIVNDHDVTSHPLQTGDRILIGDTEIHVEVVLPEELNEKTTRDLTMLPGPKDETLGS